MARRKKVELVRVRLTEACPGNGYHGGGLALRKGEVVTVDREVLDDRQDLHPGWFEEVADPASSDDGEGSGDDPNTKTGAEG